MFSSHFLNFVMWSYYIVITCLVFRFVMYVCNGHLHAERFVLTKWPAWADCVGIVLIHYGHIMKISATFVRFIALVSL